MLLETDCHDGHSVPMFQVTPCKRSLVLINRSINIYLIINISHNIYIIIFSQIFTETTQILGDEVHKNPTFDGVVVSIVEAEVVREFASHKSFFYIGVNTIRST